jgi:hypothetical protein
MTLQQLCDEHKLTPEEREKVYIYFLAMRYGPYLLELHVLLKRLNGK